MEIDKDLKLNLISDVENILGIDLDEDKKQALERSFEITISVHDLGASKIQIGTALDKMSSREIDELAKIAQSQRGVILVCGPVRIPAPPVPNLEEKMKRVDELLHPAPLETIFKEPKPKDRRAKFGRKPSRY
ncbi:hypothetical protein [Draconibacterium sp.]|uniref:hypothetical protein n=1 Tax=Draconibacterium sp. TaxID=1965318 RepID=UPI003563573E